MEGASSSERRRLTTYSSESKNKACIIFYCLEACYGSDNPWGARIECNICIVDLKSDVLGGGDDGFTRVSPTLQIDYGAGDMPKEDAFCVLGETLYVLEGCADDDAIKKSVFAFDLTQINSLNQNSMKLEKGGPLLKNVGHMMFPKAAPAALPTPDGEKIVVFPTENMLNDDDEIPPFGGFEMFDPVNPQSPEQLPSITALNCEQIEAYGFIQNSNKLLVQITCAGMYVLDLDSPADERSWGKLGFIHDKAEFIPPMVARPSFFETVDEGRFCFVNRFGLYDLKECTAGGDRPVGGFFAPLQAYDSEIGYGRDLSLDCRVARCLNEREEEEEGKYHLCQMMMERSDRYTESCRVAIIVCCVDLKSYKEILEQMPNVRYTSMLKLDNTKVVKKHKFLLDLGGKRHLDYPPHLFFTF